MSTTDATTTAKPKTTKEAAQRLGVSVGTLRNWSDQFAAFLSESARPGYQPERRFTGLDMVKLAYIKGLRSEGLQAEQIRQRLGETKFTESEVIETTDANKPQQAPTDVTLESPADSRQGPETAILSIQVLDAINAQNRKIEALERSGRPGWWLFVAGVLCGLGFAAVAELFALVAKR